MPTLTVDGYGTFEIEAGTRLVLALEHSGIDVLHRCGGKARCTTCLVIVSAGEPVGMTEAEKTVLEAKGLVGQGRLSCQMTCDADMTVAPMRTASSSGLDAGPAPAEGIEPDPMWV